MLKPRCNTAPHPKQHIKERGSTHLAPQPPALPAPTAGCLLFFSKFKNKYILAPPPQKALPFCISDLHQPAASPFRRQSLPGAILFSFCLLREAPSRRGARDWQSTSPGALVGERDLPAVGPWHWVCAAVSARAPVRVPFTSRRRLLRAAPAASAPRPATLPSAGGGRGMSRGAR